MVEPYRKVSKDKGAETAPIYSDGVGDRLVFTTTHPTTPIVVDLRQFETGRDAPVTHLPKWGGAFRGRPQLIREIAPYIYSSFANAPATTARTLVCQLRSVWRILDSCDDVAPVESVSDLNFIHNAVQMRTGLSADALNTFLRCVNPVRIEKGLPALSWIRTARKNGLSDLPAQLDIARIHEALQKRVRAIQDRWAEADRIFLQGKNWLCRLDERPQNLPWTKVDRLATYEAVAKSIKHPCPSQDQFAGELGYTTSSRALTDFFDVVYSFFPSKEDVQMIFFLFLLKTGWNISSALNLDCSEISQCIRPHPLSTDHHVLSTIKARGGTEQVAIGLDSSTLSAGNLIRMLAVRTSKLREHLKFQLFELEQRAQRTDEDLLVEAELRRRTQSAWLYVRCRAHNEIDALDIETYGLDANCGSAIKRLINQINDGHTSEARISDQIKISDFRDAYIAYAYESSGYSWLATQLAAGHSNLESLKTYLRKRRWKSHGERRVHIIQSRLWDEIRNLRIVDPAILRAWVERGVITEDQRRRWQEHKDRTRIGTGCMDFFHPPKDISPEHKPGTGCRIQRCTLCGHAVIFQDSLNGIARRMAELELIQRDIPLVSWHQSSFPDELQKTLEILNRFDASMVEKALVHWRSEIRAGRYTPFSQEGSYGA